VRGIQYGCRVQDKKGARERGSESESEREIERERERESARARERERWRVRGRGSAGEHCTHLIGEVLQLILGEINILKLHQLSDLLGELHQDVVRHLELGEVGEGANVRGNGPHLIAR